LAQGNGIPLNLKGVYVERITQNGPADKAGIHGSTTDQYLKKHLGDVITAVDVHNITKRDDLLNYIGQNKIAGNNITLTDWTRYGSESNTYCQTFSDPISDYKISRTFNPPSPNATSDNTYTTSITFFKRYEIMENRIHDKLRQ